MESYFHAIIAHKYYVNYNQRNHVEESIFLGKSVGSFWQEIRLHTTPNQFWIKSNLPWEWPSKPQSRHPKGSKKLEMKILDGWIFSPKIPTGIWTRGLSRAWRTLYRCATGLKGFSRKKLQYTNLSNLNTVGLRTKLFINPNCRWSLNISFPFPSVKTWDKWEWE